MTGVVRWNFQRLVDLKLQGVELPGVFDPQLIAELNTSSLRVTGKAKYPTLQITNRDTGERFGLRYLEPGCRPVSLNWDQEEDQHSTAPAVAEEQRYSAPEEQQPLPGPVLDVAPKEIHGTAPDDPVGPVRILSAGDAASPVKMEANFLGSTDLHGAAPLPVSSSPRAARTGPVKTGGLVHVLDHSRWTAPMRAAIEELLIKHHHAKDILKRVDSDYAAMVQRTCTDPNSLLHPTTRQHISRYVRHQAKLKNTSSALNTSPEKLQQRQKLWQSLTTGSQTASVPVTTLPPATVNPPPVSAPQGEPITRATVEQIVKEVLDVQKQQQPQTQKKARNCLACGQPKSRYFGDGSSVHYFFRGEDIKYFYCSSKVFKTYEKEGLKNPRMTFEEFAKTPFFETELEAARQRGAEWKRVVKERAQKRSAGSLPSGRMCRFCHEPLKQGPNSPHIHNSFPGVAGKYIYCPSKVFSLYREQGMTKEMSWLEFQQSQFFEAEKLRWLAERKK